MKRIMMVSLVSLVAICALAVSWSVGPLGSLPEVVRIDDSYFAILRSQYLFVGLSTGVVTVVTALVLGVNLRIAAAALFVIGSLVPTLSWLVEPNSGVSWLSEFAEFFLPYFGACLLVLGAIASARAILRRNAKSEASV